MLEAIADFLRLKGRLASLRRISLPAVRAALVHIYVFEAGTLEQRDPNYVSSLVRSLLPESMVYGEVPISFIFDQNMPAAIGHGTAPDVEKVTRYSFAWSKIKETDPDLVDGLKVGRENCTFSWEEYERAGGNRGVLFAFYELNAQ